MDKDLTIYIDKNKSSLNKIEADNHKAKLLAEDTMLIKSWLISKQGRTRLSYQSDIKDFFNHYISFKLMLNQYTEAHVGLYLDKIEHLKPSTRSRKKAALSSLFKFLLKRKHIDRNPVELLSTIKVEDRTQFRLLTHNEVLRMIELEIDHRNKIMITTLYKTALRISELLNIKYNDIKKSENGYRLVVVGKGTKTRSINIDDKLKEDLDSLKVWDEEFSNEFVFKQKKRNDKISKKSAWQIIKSSAIKAGLDPEISPHWIRHASATTMLRNGADLRNIQHILGHSSMATTAKYLKIDTSFNANNFINL